MTCGAHPTRSRSAAKALRAPRQLEVMGTWDFKWTPGKSIRVAFQEPYREGLTSSELDAVIDEIKALASTWIDGRASIRFEWEPYRLRATKPGEPQNRSPFEALTAQTFADRNYDVLVSLDALPIQQRDPVSGNVLDDVFLPKSELGAYARRQDYGVPTVFLGPVAGESAGYASLADYYAKSPLARFYVVHEFGHVLGLAHEHQNPRRREQDKGLAALSGRVGTVAERLGAILAKPLGTQISGEALIDFVRRHVTEPWPGGKAFSDWREDTADSVLFVPYYHCLAGTHPLDPGAECAECRAGLRSAPSQSDLDQLATRYPPRKPQQ